MKAILFLVGLILVIGSIGACDTGAIALTQAIKQCAIGLPIIAIGCM